MFRRDKFEDNMLKIRQSSELTNSEKHLILSHTRALMDKDDIGYHDYEDLRSEIDWLIDKYDE